MICKCRMAAMCIFIVDTDTSPGWRSRLWPLCSEGWPHQLQSLVSPEIISKVLQPTQCSPTTSARMDAHHIYCPPSTNGSNPVVVSPPVPTTLMVLVRESKLPRVPPRRMPARKYEIVHQLLSLECLSHVPQKH